MTKNPKISCIMPAYNAGKYLKVAIDSILNQTFKDFELIIINDGSSDNTEDIILSYDDSRIVYIKNERNLKLMKTLNKGIDKAKGEFISRMDSDDQAHPSLFERELQEFEKHPDAGIVNILTNHMSEDGLRIRPNRQYFKISPDVCSVVCIYANMISHPGVMVRGNLMRKYHYSEDEKYLHFEDFELWCRMFENGIKCYTLPERLLNYRMTSTSINSLYAKERHVRKELFKISYIQRRWNYNYQELPEILDVKTFMQNYISLSKLWKFLKKYEYISFFTYWRVKIWQIHYFLGIGKRIFLK